MKPDVEPVVTLGNLTRGFHTVVATALWGRDVQVVAALGHGRSSGSNSRMLVRTLPGSLDPGLSRRLEAAAPTTT